MNIAYVRVSTLHQSDDRQKDTLEKFNIEKWYSEKISAKDKDRPKLKEMLDFAREGDTIYIDEFSRIARSTKDLLSITEELENKKIKFVSVKENIDTSTPSGKLMLTMIGAINEFERANMLERQREGIEIAKKKGKFKGRRKKIISNFDEKYNLYLQRKLNKTQLAYELGISRTLLYKLLEEKEKAKKIECNSDYNCKACKNVKDCYKGASII